MEELELMSTSVVDDTALLNHCANENSRIHMTIYVMPMKAGQVFEALLFNPVTNDTKRGDMDLYLNWGDCPLMDENIDAAENGYWPEDNEDERIE
jgi:hypothetical protein